MVILGKLFASTAACRAGSSTTRVPYRSSLGAYPDGRKDYLLIGMVHSNADVKASSERNAHQLSILQILSWSLSPLIRRSGGEWKLLVNLLHDFLEFRRVRRRLAVGVLTPERIGDPLMVG